MNKVIAFDLDGTLVNSIHHLLPAYYKALESLNLPRLPDEVLMQAIGGTIADNHELIMPNHTFDEYMCYELAVAKYATEYAKTHGESYPNVMQMLDNLRESGYITVLCSNGSKEYIHPLLKVIDLDSHLCHIQTLSHEKNKTELLSTIIQRFDSAEHTILVGDRKFDAEAARNNHIPFVGCRYGLFPNEIDEANPAAILNNPSELPEVALRLLGAAK